MSHSPLPQPGISSFRMFFVLAVPKSVSKHITRFAYPLQYSIWFLFTQREQGVYVLMACHRGLHKKECFGSQVEYSIGPWEKDESPTWRYFPQT